MYVSFPTIKATFIHVTIASIIASYVKDLSILKVIQSAKFIHAGDVTGFITLVYVHFLV